MSLSVSNQAKWWGIIFVVFMVLLYLFGNILVPFLVGAAIAYFLDPVADKMEARGMSRIWATLIISIGALVFAVITFLLIMPFLLEQAVSLVHELPTYFNQMAAFLERKYPTLTEEGSVLNRSIQTVGKKLSENGGSLLNGLITSASGIVNIIIISVVAFVVAFYMLLDWDGTIAKIDSWLPREHVETIRGLAREIDMVLAGFLRGQLSVCAILGVFYSVSLMLAGLQFGGIIGLIAGLISFIPYIGSLVGGGLAIGLALFQFWDDPMMIGVVAAIFFIGQIIEGNYLTPKLVGGSVGLHPVWLMFALSAFGSLFGLVGMLVAVPFSACLGVFFRFGIKQYMHSKLYLGPAKGD